MFLNDVAWSETASHHLTEKGNSENAESKEVPTIQLYFLMLRILSWNLLSSYIYISTGKHKTKSVLKVETTYWIWPSSV